MKILIAIYHHPEAYPPTLSAIDQLAGCAETIGVVCRNTMPSRWEYPENVRLRYTTTKQYDGFEIEKISKVRKILHFIQFVRALRSMLRNDRPEILLLYDVIPLFAAFILKKRVRKNKTFVWYHNHDTTDLSKAGRFSVTGIAARFEKRSFGFLDLFSLPAKERMAHFPADSFPGKVFIIPNYPLKRFYRDAVPPAADKEAGKITLVFQGSIGPGHGLEEIIPLLDRQVAGKPLELHLAGKVRPGYLASLEELAGACRVRDRLFYHGQLPFAALPAFLASFHMGLAIHKPYNVTYSTGGSASNKIYEYAACGLPVLLFDTPHYREYLGNYPWAFFTDLTKSSILQVISEINGNYEALSRAAGRSFGEVNNFENAFSEVKEFVCSGRR